MNHVKIYTKTHCPYSIRAKEILKRRGASFEEIDIAKDPSRRQEMISAANGRTTVPQVFIADRHIGGCDDLSALDDKGELEQLLGGGPQASA